MRSSAFEQLIIFFFLNHCFSAKVPNFYLFHEHDLKDRYVEFNQLNAFLFTLSFGWEMPVTYFRVLTFMLPCSFFVVNNKYDPVFSEIRFLNILASTSKHRFFLFLPYCVPFVLFLGHPSGAAILIYTATLKKKHAM